MWRCDEPRAFLPSGCRCPSARGRSEIGRPRRIVGCETDLAGGAQQRRVIWRGAQRYGNFRKFKSVYSIFVSRVDVYTEKHVPTLSSAAQGLVGIVGAKRIWAQNKDFWADKKLPLDQEIVFASTGTASGESVNFTFAAFSASKRFGVIVDAPSYFA